VLLTYEAKNLPYTVRLCRASAELTSRPQRQLSNPPLRPQLDMIDFDAKPEWLMALNGGKVPVIREPGKDYMPGTSSQNACTLSRQVAGGHPPPRSPGTRLGRHHGPP
jgi:hypothetical protein